MERIAIQSFKTKLYRLSKKRRESGRRREKGQESTRSVVGKLDNDGNYLTTLAQLVMGMNMFRPRYSDMGSRDKSRCR